MRQKNRPIEILEESLQILRSAGAPILLQYWTGAIPFAVALLLLLHDAGKSWGASLLLRDSLVCAVAFVWLSYWKSRASDSIFVLLSPGYEADAGWIRRAALQAIFQTVKLFVMPFAMVSLLAWAPASAFFRTLALEPLPEDQPMRGGLQRAFTSATHRYTENVVAYLTIAAFTLITWLNVLVTVLFIPVLWKILTGYETDWSRMEEATVYGLFRVAAVTAWLLMDPWIQTYCMLRVFYLNARTDGRDLLRDIGRLAAVVLVCSAAMTNPVNAAQANPQQALNQSISHASQADDYQWLRPQKSSEGNGFLGDLAQKMRDGFTAAGKQVKRWSRGLMYWLRNLLGKDDTPLDDKSSQPVHTQELRWTLAVIAVLICGGIVALFLRRRRKNSSMDMEGAARASPAADVLNEEILPSEVKQEEWLRMAFEYLAGNQTRLSARAFYLANLSYLGTQGRLSLSLSKTNRLYERELARQPKAAEMQSAFATGNRLYERAWFGMRELGMDQMEVLKRAVDQLRQHA